MEKKKQIPVAGAVHRAVKEEAARQGVPMSELAERFITKGVEEAQAARRSVEV